MMWANAVLKTILINNDLVVLHSPMGIRREYVQLFSTNYVSIPNVIYASVTT